MRTADIHRDLNDLVYFGHLSSLMLESSAIALFIWIDCKCDFLIIHQTLNALKRLLLGSNNKSIVPKGV